MESKSLQIEKQQTVTPGSTKRRTKFWKPPIVNVDEEEVAKTNSSSSIENSRRGSMCSSQGSPIKVSPKKGKDQKSKKSSSPTVGGGQDDVHRKSRRNSKEKSESPRDENRLSAGARLYRVMEEQALGEAIGGLNENSYTGESRRMSLCSPVTSSPNFRYTPNI